MNINQRKITKLHEVLSRFKKNKVLKVLLLGAYGSGNVGDLAILDAMMDDLANDKEISYCVASRDLFLKQNYDMNLINPFSIRGLLEAFRQDVIVVGGGGIFGHETHIHMKIMMPFLIIAKKLLRKNVVFYDIGVYQAENKIMLKLLWFIMRYADDIIFRDDTDINIIPKDILQHAKIEPDITFSLNPKEPRHKNTVELLHSSDNIVGLSLRFVNLKNMYNEYDDRIARAVNQVVKDEFLNKGMTVLFIPFQDFDLTYVKHYFGNLVDEYPHAFLILETEKYTINEIKWVISKLQLAVGMRLHFQIFAHDLDIPIVGISYAPKNTNFLMKIKAPLVNAYSITIDDLKNAVVKAQINTK